MAGKELSFLVFISDIESFFPTSSKTEKGLPSSYVQTPTRMKSTRQMLFQED